MLSNSWHIYEDTINAQHITALIGLSYTENDLLAELSEPAKTVAPHLGRALTTRIRMLAGTNNELLLSSTDMQLYLQEWFLQLFNNKNNYQLAESIPGLNQIILLTCIDLILSYCHETTRHSSNPEDAAIAIYKALALKIASEQLYYQVNLEQNLYDMMLLD